MHKITNNKHIHIKYFDSQISVLYFDILYDV